MDGRWHEGLIEAVAQDGSVAMRWVKPLIDADATVEERAAQQVKKPIPRTTFAPSDVRQIVCRTVRMSLGDVGPRSVDDVGTDAAIGRGKGGYVVVLQKWTYSCLCDIHAPPSLHAHSMVGRQLERWEGPTEGGLEDSMGLEEDGGRWDQFEANKRLFNVTSTFSEVCLVGACRCMLVGACWWVPLGNTLDASLHVHRHVCTCSTHTFHTHIPHTRSTHIPLSFHPQDLYSTKYDPKTSTISPAQAARIAAEIERDARSTSNPHLREERGLVVDDSQVDEEDKYSAVVRHPAAGGGDAAEGGGSGGAKRPGVAAAGSWR